MSLIEDLCVSFAASGFKRIIFLNGHYDNTYAIAYACANAADKIVEGREGVPDQLLGRADAGGSRGVLDAEDRSARQPGGNLRRAPDQSGPRGHGQGERRVPAVPRLQDRRPARSTRRSSSRLPARSTGPPSPAPGAMRAAPRPEIGERYLQAGVRSTLLVLDEHREDVQGDAASLTRRSPRAAEERSTQRSFSSGIAPADSAPLRLCVRSS